MVTLQKQETEFDRRIKRYCDAFTLGTPDRVPHESRFGDYWALDYAGFPIKGSVMNAKTMGVAMEKLATDFATDTCPTLFSRNPLYYKFLKSKSFVESENGYMQHPEVSCLEREEYGMYIADPFKTIVETILPRVYEALATKSESKKILTLPLAMQIQNDSMAPLLGEVARISQTYQLPVTSGGLLEAPMDYLADMIRGFTQILTDMRKVPGLLEEAVEATLPLMLKLGRMAPKSPDKPISVPLHMPTFMNHKQFERFFWPTFLKMIQTLTEEGHFFRIYFEDDWTRYLDYLQELPKGKILGSFEYMDPRLFKEKLGKTMCITGGFDVTILGYARPQEVLDRAKAMMDVLSPGGGFIFTVAKGITYPGDAKKENVRALYEFVPEYGKY